MKTLISTVAVIVGLEAATAHAGEILNVVERATHEKTLHRSAKPDALGDLIVFANDIYTSSNQQHIGTDQGYCVRVAIGKSWECFWTLQLKDGAIMSHGPFLDSGDGVMAVTGGTGKYAGARGVLTVRARADKETAYDFRYELL